MEQLIQGLQKARAQREPFDMFQKMAMGEDTSPDMSKLGFAGEEHKPGEMPPGPGGMPTGGGAPPMPGNIFGSDPEAGAAIVIDAGGVNAEESRASCVKDGAYDAEGARDLCIVATDGHTGGVYVSGEGVSYTLENAVIRLSGNSAGLGGKASGAAADNGAKLTLRGCDIEVSGKARSTTSSTNGSELLVYDSRLVCHGAPFSEDAATPSGRVRDIQGNARCHITMGNSKSWFFHSQVISDGWAALSTDIAQGYVSVEANDCLLQTTHSGYAAYADGGCEVVINNSQIRSACMAGVIAGEAGIVYRGCEITCNTFGNKFHCIGMPQEVGRLTLEDCTCHTAQQGIVVYSHNAEIAMKGTRMTSDSGVALEVLNNPDPNAAKTGGKQVYGVHVTLEDCRIEGSFLHSDTDRTTSLYLTSSSVRGQMVNIELWMQDGGTWYATADSSVTLVGAPAVSQFDAPAGVTITAKAAQSGSFDLASGGKLILRT